MDEATKKRMVEEHEQLKERIIKLDAFMNGDVFKELPLEERSDLVCQEHAMVLYERFLSQRVWRATRKN